MKLASRKVGVALLAAVSLGSLSACESSNEDTSKSGSKTESTVGKGIGSKDASADVTSIECTGPDAIGMFSAKVTITNNSSKPSDYFITIVAESSDGATRYDDTIVTAMALNSGQTTTVEGPFLNDLPAGAICKVSEVQRTAS
jgi:hypothetical protein